MLGTFERILGRRRLGACILLAAVALVLALGHMADARRVIGDIAKTAFTLRPQAVTATINGTGVDRLNYQSVIAVLDLGAATGTGVTCDCKLQESDTSGGTYTDLSPSVTFTQLTDTSDNSRQEKSVDLAGKKRFVRATCTVAGTSPNLTMSIIFVLGEPGAHPLP